MKKILLLLVLALAAVPQCIMADSKDKTNPSEDRYNVTDADGMLAFGKSYYEVNGKPSGANGNFYSTSHSDWSMKGWPDSNKQKHVATYIHFPKCTTNAKMQLTTKGTASINVVVTCMENGAVIYEGVIDMAKGAKQWVDVMPEMQMPVNGWYKFDFECTKNPANIGEFFYWQFKKTGSTEKIYTADYMSSPSVHLSGWKTTDPTAPSPAYYDWVYEEVMVPESSAVVGTYCMSLGVLHGYMGIQIDSDNDYPIIFSMWDNGSTDEDPYLPEYLRSGALDWEKGVTIARFANEGTGAQAKYRTGKNWIPGKWVKFISNARPEIIDVEIDDPAHPGQKKTITYTNTLCSAWFMADGLDDDWHYIATIRQSGANNYFDGWYSFLENYNWPTGQWQRKAYYRNGGLHSLSNGKWYHANSVGFGHTDGGDKYGDRRDYGQGQTEDFDNSFFMSTGGYHEDPVQNAQVLPLKRNYMPVDQATLDRLTERVNQAIRNEQVVAMKENISNACTIYPQSTFKVIAKSDEATNEGAGNIADAVFDGNESTYWHSKWSGGETPYPHTLTIEVSNPEDVRIGQISLVQQRASNYRVKQLTVSTSTDNKTWTKAETVTLDDTNNPNAEFANPISAPYIKLSFDKGYGTNLLCINEIYFKSAPSIDDLKKQVADIIAHADQFNGYASADLTGVKAAYADGTATDFAALSKALNDLAANAQPLKFGRVDEMKNLSSFKAYQLHNVNGQGDLVAAADGKLSLTGVTDKAVTDAKLTAPTNVTLPENNWLLVHSAHTGQYYLYNLGVKKFLQTGTTCSLSDEPVPVTPAKATSGFTFRTGTGSNDYVSAQPATDTPVKGSTAGNKGSVWELRDNYYATPDYAVAEAVLAAIDYAADYAIREQKAKAAKGFLEFAKADAAKDYDKKYAGIYDTSALEAALAKAGASVDEVAAAYDQARASAMPRTDRYYRLVNYKRPVAGAKDNYLTLTGTKEKWNISSKTNTEFGPAPTSTLVAENYRLFKFEKADNDTTFNILCAATGTYLLTQNTDKGISSNAKSIAISCEGDRLFRMSADNQYITVSGANALTQYGTKEDAELFYFEEVLQLEDAVSTQECGYGWACLPASVQLPDGVEALVVTSVADGQLHLAPLNGYLAEADANLLPAGLPVVLHSTNGKAVAPTACAIVSQNIDASRAKAANILGGANYKLTISKNDYVFNEECTAIQKSTGTSLRANTPYLTAAHVPEGFTGIFVLDTTDIRQIVIDNADGSHTTLPASILYDLQGRITNAQKGIFIQNAEKHIK